MNVENENMTGRKSFRTQIGITAVIPDSCSIAEADFPLLSHKAIASSLNCFVYVRLMLT